MTRKHPTSSVFVFGRTGEGWRLGLIEHPRYGRMMIPGGHVESEESQAEAALREVAEEAGLAVRLVSPPGAPMPGGYRLPRVAQPWWIVEYDVPPDNHLDAAHVHIDHLYVALADGAPAWGGAAGPGLAERGVAGSELAERGAAGSELAERAAAGSELAERAAAGLALGEPAHPFAWYAAADLPGLHMFEDARTMALALLSGLSGHAGDATDPSRLSAALLASLG